MMCDSTYPHEEGEPVTEPDPEARLAGASAPLGAGGPEGVAVRTEVRGQVGVIILDDKARRNALSAQIAGSAVAALESLRASDVRAVVLRAAAGSYIAANGSALSYGGQFWYWYETGARDRLRISLARSADARAWQPEPAPVVDAGPAGSWDERAVVDPYVIRIEPYFYLYYLGQDRAARQRIGVARSGDGVHWEKLRSNPVVEMDEEEAGIGEPAVWQSDGFYWMLYTVRDFAENRYLRLARSTDGVRWTKLAVQYKGTQAWNSKAICDPTVVVEGGRILVWFGGGDVASPDENLHGQIGFATLAR